MLANIYAIYRPVGSTHEHIWSTRVLESGSRYFADQGYQVFSADYRLNFDAPWPAQRTDAVNAIDYVKNHSATFHVDPGRIIVLGSSSGGHLATIVGTYGAAGSRVKGIIGLSPYRAWNDGNHDASTPSQRKVRDNAAILARCYPDSADTAVHQPPGLRFFSPR